MATSALIAKLPFPKDVQNIIMDKVNAFDDLLVCGLNMKKEVVFYAHRNVHKPNATFVKVDKRTGKETAASFQTMAKMRVLCLKHRLLMLTLLRGPFKASYHEI